MKKLYFTALSFICVMGLNAQTINQGNFEPLNGEQFATIQIDSLNASVGPNGPSVTWTFPITMRTHTFFVANYTTTTGNYTAWPSSSVAVTASTDNIAYYSGNASDLKYWGGQLKFGAAPAELKFSTPQVYMPYPTGYNGGTISPVAGSVAAIGQAGTFTGVCTVSATATGTLVLPLKTFSNVIRVKNEISVSFTVGAFPGTGIRINYDFYSLDHSKYPILTISQSTINSALGNSSQNYLYAQKNYQNVSLKNEAAQALSSLEVYPNPSSTSVNFVTENTQAKAVSVFDINGKLIDTQLLSNGKLNLNVTNYNNGLYIYKLINSNNQSLKTGKLTVNH